MRVRFAIGWRVRFTRGSTLVFLAVFAVVCDVKAGAFEKEASATGDDSYGHPVAVRRWDLQGCLTDFVEPLYDRPIRTAEFVSWHSL